MRFQRKEVPKFNFTSMADMSFLLLIFFLVSSSLESKTGIYRQLASTHPEVVLKRNTDILERNMMTVRIDSVNTIRLKEEIISLHQLKAIAKTFIDNPEYLDYLPEKGSFEAEFVGTFPASDKHIIELVVDRKSNYQTYLSVLSELTAAYNELRSEFSESHFQKPFIHLTDEQQETVRKIYPQRISETEPEKGGKP